MKKVHSAITFNQDEWSHPFIEMNTKLSQTVKNKFEKDFFKLMNNAVFGKTIENVRKHRDIKLVITKRRRKYLVSEPNYDTTKFFTENLLAIALKKTHVIMNKPVYLRFSILDLSKTVIYEFWYDYTKPNYSENPKLCYMDRDSFITCIKKQMIFTEILQEMLKQDLMLKIIK